MNINLNNIEKDKIAGFGSCAVLAWSVSRVLRACGVQTPCCLLTGSSVAVIAGVAKDGTAGLFTPAAMMFIQDSIQTMIPWLMVMFTVSI